MPSQEINHLLEELEDAGQRMEAVRQLSSMEQLLELIM